MSGFDDREKAAENKKAREEELKFKKVARRNKLLGLWAAELMGITGAAAEAYAKEVIAADLESSGDDDLYRKVAGDLEKKGVAMSEHRIRRRMEELLIEAERQLAKG
jgi:hypothetical protein